MHLYYQGFPEETVDRARDKLEFEKERLLNMQNEDHIDTFEKFLEFSEDNVSEADKKIRTPKNTTTASLYFEGGSPTSTATNVCNICRCII
jgi:hypothetical protein